MDNYHYNPLQSQSQPIVYPSPYPKLASKALQYIKGKSGRKLLQEFELLRKRYWGQHLWARGYFVVSVGNVNSEEVQRYIEQQEEHHKKDDFRISEF